MSCHNIWQHNTNIHAFLFDFGNFWKSHDACSCSLQMVARLKAEIQDLRDELSLATGEQRTDELTQEEKDKLGSLLNDSLTHSHIQECLLHSLCLHDVRR